jgi:hypothetical protein
VKFCSQTCVAKWRNSDPEIRKKMYTKERNQKIKQSLLLQRKTERGKIIIAQSSERMKKVNPMHNPLSVEKMKNTQRINGTLNVWPGKRGGNGQLTKSQKIISALLGWEMEIAISLGKKLKGFPTCYKIDVGNRKLKIAIELDGTGHNSKKNTMLDRKKTIKLQELGWTVLRFTNEEVMTNLSKVLLEIKNVIKDM